MLRRARYERTTCASRPSLLTAALLSALSLVSAPLGAVPLASDALRLRVTRDAGSERCPTREALRALVAARLDGEPITEDAPGLATLRFSRRASRFEATLRIERPRRRVTTRRLRARTTDCARLGEAVALVLAIAIDPMRALRRPDARAEPVTPSSSVGDTAAPVVAPPPTPPTPATASPTTPPTPATLSSPPPTLPTQLPTQRAAAEVPRPVRWELGALATSTWGVSPGLLGDDLGVGLSLRATRRFARVSLPLWLDVDAPGRFDDDRRGAHVGALPVSIGAGAGLHGGSRITWEAAAIVAAGAVTAWGSGYANARADVAFAASVGVRLGVALPLSSRWRLVASLDARTSLVRPSLQLRSEAPEVLWTAPLFTATLAIGVAWQNR